MMIDEGDDENKIYDVDETFDKITKHRKENIVKDFKLRKIIMGQILKLHEDNLEVAKKDREDDDFKELFGELKKVY